MFLLRSIRCEEPLLFLPHDVTEENYAEKYLAAQERWVRQGLAELDFDGKLSVKEPLDRVTYDLRALEAALRWERGEEITCWMLCGGDLLRACFDGKEMTLSLRRASELYGCCKDTVAKDCRGVVAAMCAGTGKRCRWTAEESGEDWPMHVAECLAAVLWRSKDAPERRCHA